MIVEDKQQKKDKAQGAGKKRKEKRIDTKRWKNTADSHVTWDNPHSTDKESKIKLHHP